VRTSLSASEALISAERSRFLGRGGTEVGFDLYWSDLDLSRSTLSGFGTAITGSMSYLDIARSVLHRNGIAVRTRPNLYGGDAHIQRSTFAANGVALDLADNATVRGNLLVRNRRGIVAAPLGPGPEPTTSSIQLYEGNTVALTRGTGITATGPVVTLTRNVVFGSRGQAIVATDVVDGGGNRAFRNRGLPQCVGVVCEER
jgi:hypothetical protein